MRWQDRLKHLGLVMLADSLADLAGILEEVRSADERDRAAARRTPERLRRRGSPVSRADGGRADGLRSARVRRTLGECHRLPRG